MNVAIVGLSCKFPGANNYSEFWNNLIEKKSSITEIPLSRWNWKEYWGTPNQFAQKSLSKWGGFLNDINAFDANFFGILPKVVEAMDPQQRLMLELVWECLEDAGIAPSSLRGRKVGVMLGVFNHDYKEMQEAANVAIEAHYSTGTAASIIANRVSHFFDFKGPSFPIDTACSSSLNAIHSAIQALKYNDCELALAGGVSLLLTPTRHISFSKMGMLSPTGQCNTFDDTANGYVRGEGAGVILLKPLDKALADGDAIYGIIKGTAINHCGETYTLTYPNSIAQANVIIEAHERASVPINTINYMETHGTGTPKGDPIEFEGLLHAFRTLASRQNIELSPGFCALGSVKTNIGHLEAAAGIAGVIKVLLSFHHQQLPPLQNFTRLNARISLEDTPFSMLSESKQWLPEAVSARQEKTTAPLRAGVSSFGFGGTNAHIVLENFSAKKSIKSKKKYDYLIALSAKTPVALRKIKHNLCEWLNSLTKDIDLLDLSAGLLIGRDHFHIRSCYVVQDVQQIYQLLQDELENKDSYTVINKDNAEALNAATQSALEIIDVISLSEAKRNKKSYTENLKTLADLYLSGANPSWANVFSGMTPERLHLPTYPFDKDIFSLGPKTEINSDTKPEQGLHPLLHKNISSNGRQCFYSLFTGDEFYLKDHKIKGQSVMPAVAYLEMVREAMQHSSGDIQRNKSTWVTEIRDVIWLSPFVVANNAKELRVNLSPLNYLNVSSVSSSVSIKFEIFSGFEELSLIKNCQGKATLIAQETPKLVLDLNYPSPDWHEQTSLECYAQFSSMGFDYGAAQQSIELLAIKPGQALVKLVLPNELKKDNQYYQLHPSVTDGALQAAVALISGATWKTKPDTGDDKPLPYLPFSVESLRIYGPTQAIQWAWIRFSEARTELSTTTKIDIDIFKEIPLTSEPIELIAQFKGLGLRQFGQHKTTVVEPTSNTLILSRDNIMDVSSSYYTPQWFEKSIINVTALPINSLLILGNSEDVIFCISRLKKNVNFEKTIFIAVEFSDAYLKKSVNQYTLRPGLDTDFQMLIKDIASDTFVPQHVLFLSKSDGESLQECDVSIEQDLSRGAESAFCLVKAYLKAAKSARFINLVPREKGSFIPAYQALSGFYKTIKVERPAYNGRVVLCHYPTLNDSAFAELINTEFSDTAFDTDISYSRSARYIREFVTCQDLAQFKNITSTSSKTGFKVGGVYLITGGLGALGLLVASHLVQQYKARVYLTGRSLLSAEKAEQLSQLTAKGGHIDYIACDIADVASVHKMVQQINDNGFLLNGVIHSAGVIEDNFILKKEFDSFSRVISPKTRGTVNIDIATKNQPLDVFVLFSSVTGVLGNLGQCDYAFGNSFEDYYSFYRNDLVQKNKRPGKSTSINWPYWKEGGMVLTDKEEAILRKNFGITPLENASGLAALEFAITASISQLAVLEGDANKVQQVLGVRTLRAGDVVNETLLNEEKSESVDSHKIKSNSKELVFDIKNDVVEYLICQFAKEVNLPEDRFELYAPFQQYGFDSVVMVGLVLMFEEKFENLPATLFFEYQNINDLADFFVANYADHFSTTKNHAVTNNVTPLSPTINTTPIDSNALKNKVVNYLIDQFAKEVNLPKDRFELYTSFQQYGFDSVVMVGLVLLLEEKFENLPATLFFEYHNINDLADFFINNYSGHFIEESNPSLLDKPHVNSTVNNIAVLSTVNVNNVDVKPSLLPVNDINMKDEIAIIGISGRYPEAENLTDYWNNLKNGVDCIREVPEDRNWNMENLFQPGPATLGKSYSKWGGFLKAVDQFDSLFFGISPAEVETMDPHERLFLETVALAIEDAGYCPDQLAKSAGVHENPVGVYAGLMWGDYQLWGIDGETPKEILAPRSWYWAVANRISYQFNFSGPSITLDTACSSSLTAIHLGCEALKQGDIQVAIAGGVNLSLHPQKYNNLSNLHFLSSDGRCRSFGVGGTGYVPAEAVGAVILKRKSDAIQDGDHIYAIIKSTSINHGGKTSGFTVPNPNRQAALVKDAINKAGLDPRHISYIEAHGTGTSLGDPIEIAALTKAYDQSEHQYCAIGSVKSNIGHAEAAAGIAGLTKVILQLKHKMLAPSLHSTTLNPYAKIEQSPFHVLQELQEWKRPLVLDASSGKLKEIPRIAALSSFGAGGANGHFIIEEYLNEEDARYVSRISLDPVLILLSAKKEDSLNKMIEQLYDFIVSGPDMQIIDIAYTLQTGRVHMDYSVAIIATTLDDLQKKLKTCIDKKTYDDLSSDDIYYGKRPRNKNTKNNFFDQKIDDFIEKKDLHNLADAWIKGQENITWKSLYNANQAFRIPVPGYVYSRQRHWISIPKKPEVANSLGSLIDANVSVLNEQLFVKTFKQDAFYLKDHKLGNKSVLPGVAYLEMAKQAAQLASNGSNVLGLTDIKWLKPIVVNGAQETINIALHEHNKNIEFEIFKIHSGGIRIVYCTGNTVIAGYSSASAVANMTVRPPIIDPNAIKMRSTLLTEQQINISFESFGFAFGPSFQVMKNLYFNKTEAMAELILAPELLAQAQEYTLHPALLDGALRTAVGIGGFMATDAGLPLPISLSRIFIHQPLIENCISYAVYSAVQPSQAQQTSYDIYILNLGGEILAILDGFVTQHVSHFAESKKSPDQIAVTDLLKDKISGVAIEQRNIQSIPVRAITHASVGSYDEELLSGVKKYLTNMISQSTKIPESQIDTAIALESYGIDSVMIMAMNEKLEDLFGQSVPKTLFFEYQDIDSLADYFVENHADDIKKLMPSSMQSSIVNKSASNTPSNADLSLHKIKSHLTALLSRFTKLESTQIEADVSLESYGIDSVMIMGMNEELENVFGQDIPKTLFFEYQTIDELALFLIESYPAEIMVMPDANQVTSHTTINIVHEHNTHNEIVIKNSNSHFMESSYSENIDIHLSSDYRDQSSTQSAASSFNNVTHANNSTGSAKLSAVEELQRTISALSDAEVEHLLRELLESDELEAEF